MECRLCGKVKPVNETFTLLGQVFCRFCIKRELEARRGRIIEPGDVVQNVDATVCHWCRSDFGNQTLPGLGGFPTCGPCERSARNRTFPRWIKALFALLVGLAVTSLVRDSRFITAAFYSFQATRAYREGRFDDAAAKMLQAAAYVPDSPIYDYKKSHYLAAQLVRENRPEEALPLLEKCRFQRDDGLTRRRFVHANPEVPNLELIALALQAFDRREWSKMVSAANQLVSSSDRHADNEYCAAFAYASRHRAQGNRDDRKAAEYHLQEARRLGDTRFLNREKLELLITKELGNGET